MTSAELNTTTKEVKFQIKFDFLPEFADKHSIDIDTYQSSLTHVKNVIKRANKISNGEKSDVKIEVVANKEGSFLVEFVVNYISSGFSSIVDVLAGLGFTGKPLYDLSMVGGIGSLFQLLLEKKTDPVIKKEVDEDTNTVKLTTESNEEYITTHEVVRYYEDDKLRDETEKITSTLRRKEIRQIGFQGIENQEEYEPLIITKNDIESFSYTGNEKHLIETNTSENQYLEVIHVDFSSSSNSWRFMHVDTKTDFEASVTDSDFIEHVQKGDISFKAGDKFYVRMLINTYEFIGSKTKRYEREIVKVHGSRPVEISEENRKDNTLDNWM